MPTKRSARSDSQTIPKEPIIDGAREVRTGLYVLVVLTAGAYLPSSLYPGYQQAFEFSDLTMTLIYATFSLVSAPALLLFGPAADALGSRPVLRASMVVAAVGSSCFALASGPIWLVVGRAAQGMALGAATGAASALISKRTHDPSQGRGAILTSTAFVAGTAAGPITSGVLAQYAPAPHVLPYLLHLALLAYGWRRVSILVSPIAPPRRWRTTRPQIPSGMRRLFTTAAMTGFLAWTVVGLFLALIPALLNRAGQTNLAVTGGVLGAVLVCSVLTQPLVARFGTRRAQLAGLGALLVSLGLLTLTAGDSVSVTLTAAIAAGAGHGLAYGGAAAAIEATAPPHQRGAITSALHLAFYLGAGCPVIAVGLITLSHPLATATSLVTATAAGLVPLAGAAVVFVGHTKHQLSSRAPRARRPNVPCQTRLTTATAGDQLTPATPPDSSGPRRQALTKR